MQKKGYSQVDGSLMVSEVVWLGCILMISNSCQSDYLCILGFECSELEQVVYTASTF